MSWEPGRRVGLRLNPACVFIPQRPWRYGCCCRKLGCVFISGLPEFAVFAAVTVSLETRPCTWLPDLRSLILHVLPLGNGQAARRYLEGMRGKNDRATPNFTKKSTVDRSIETELCTANWPSRSSSEVWAEMSDLVQCFEGEREKERERFLSAWVSLCLGGSGATPANRSILPIKVHPKPCCTFWPCAECSFT